jgi:hypothetical protein
MTQRAAALLLLIAHTASAADQGRVVLQCKGTVTISDTTSQQESGVILDFGKRLVLHNGAAYKMVNVTDSTIAFSDESAANPMRFCWLD